MNRNIIFILFHRKFILFAGIGLSTLLLILYIVFIYASVHVSYMLDYGQKNLSKQEHVYQEYQVRYITVLDGLNGAELAEEGFVTIKSPKFLSRTMSVAFRGE